MNGLGSTTAVVDRDVLHPTCSDDFRAERKYLSGVEHVNRADTITVVRPATCYKMQCVQQLFLFSFFDCATVSILNVLGHSVSALGTC